MPKGDGEPVPFARRREGWRRWIPLGLGALAGVSLLLEYGLHLREETERLLEVLDLVIAGLFGLELVSDLLLSRGRALRRRWHELLLLLLFVFALPAAGWLLPDETLGGLLHAFRVRSAARLYLLGLQVYILSSMLLQFVRGQEGLLGAQVRPGRLFVGGFAGLVLVGTGLLLLPGASAHADAPISVLDAFFTATSAVCVTGLAVRDTGGDFSVFGQLVICFLFQVGGLGIITFVALQSLSSKRVFSVPQMVALRELVNAPNMGAVRRHVLAIALTALVIETLGAVVLFTNLPADGIDVPERLLSSVFHSVSAFCNAGFGLQSDSFVQLRGDAVVNLCLAGLIVIGGLGAPVVLDVFVRGTSRFFKKEGSRRLTSQTKLSLWMTGALIVGGGIAFAALEWRGALAGASALERTLVSFFQSVTARTAGFNTCDIGALGEPALLALGVLMVIGACPVSTGGGVKVVAIGVLLLTMRSMITGRRVEIFGRAVPDRVVRASISLFVLYIASAGTVMFLLSLTDGDLPAVGRTFETVSALSTVGLSTGITADFSPAGKLILCLAMFAGRVGPLTLVMTVFRARAGAPYDLPEEAMVVG